MIETIKKYSLLAATAALALTVQTCKKDGCNDPLAFNYDPEGTTDEYCIYEPLQITLNVHPMFGDDHFVAGTDLDIEDGRRLVIDYVGMYFTQISFKEAGVRKQWSDSTMLFKTDASGTAGSVITEHRAIYYRTAPLDSLTFVLGVDSNVYTGDPTNTEEVPADSPLAPQVPTMYWSWATGYRYISIDGMVDVSDAKDGSDMQPFEYHIGLTPNLRTLRFDASDMTVNGNQLVIDLEVDLRVLFENIDLQTELVTHTSDSPLLATKIATNAVQAIQIR